jgi:hypothetical protein
METALPPAMRTLQTRRESFDPMKSYLSVAKLRHEPDDKQTAEFIINYGSKRFLGHRDGSPDERENEYEYGASVILSRELTASIFYAFQGYITGGIPDRKTFLRG